MIEVIREGNRDKAGCNSCGSLLRYETVAIIRRLDYSLADEFWGDDHYYISCPCGNEIEVTRNISSFVAERVKGHEKARELDDFDV